MIIEEYHTNMIDEKDSVSSMLIVFNYLIKLKAESKVTNDNDDLLSELSEMKSNI